MKRWSKCKSGAIYEYACPLLRERAVSGFWMRGITVGWPDLEIGIAPRCGMLTNKSNFLHTQTISFLTHYNSYFSLYSFLCSYWLQHDLKFYSRTKLLCTTVRGTVSLAICNSHITCSQFSFWESKFYYPPLSSQSFKVLPDQKDREG